MTPAAVLGAMIAGSWRHVHRAFGLVVLSTLVLCAIAVSVHHSSGLPPEYTWLRPLDVLRHVVEREYFPCLLAVAYGLGWLASPAGRELASLLRSPEQDALRRHRRQITRGAVGALGLTLVAAVGFEAYGPIDYVALAFLGAAVSIRATHAPFDRWYRGAGEFVLVLLVFSAASYGFTVLKAHVAQVVPMDRWHDGEIIAFERAITGTDPYRAIADWASQRPGWVHACDKVYYRLFDHMVLTSAFLVGYAHPRERVEYLSALAFCYLIGGAAYYLYPGLGPVYADPAAFGYLNEQWLTAPLYQRALLADTVGAADGTLTRLPSYEFVACMPSLHMAHEFVMLYYARHSRIAFAAALAFTLLSGLAVLVLGWHYATDALAGACLCLLAVTIAHRARATLLPSVVMPPEPGGPRGA